MYISIVDGTAPEYKLPGTPLREKRYSTCIGKAKKKTIVKKLPPPPPELVGLASAGYDAVKHANHCVS